MTCWWQGTLDDGFAGRGGRAAGFEPGSFDVVLYRLVLHHIAYQGSLAPVFEEAARLLRPGGALVAVEPGSLHPVGVGLALANALGLGTAVHGTPDDIPLSPGGWRPRRAPRAWSRSCTRSPTPGGGCRPALSGRWAARRAAGVAAARGAVRPHAAAAGSALVTVWTSGGNSGRARGRSGRTRTARTRRCGGGDRQGRGPARQTPAAPRARLPRSTPSASRARGGTACHEGAEAAQPPERTSCRPSTAGLRDARQAEQRRWEQQRRARTAGAAKPPRPTVTRKAGERTAPPATARAMPASPRYQRSHEAANQPRTAPSAASASRPSTAAAVNTRGSDDERLLNCSARPLRWRRAPAANTTTAAPATPAPPAGESTPRRGAPREHRGEHEEAVATTGRRRRTGAPATRRRRARRGRAQRRERSHGQDSVGLAGARRRGRSPPLPRSSPSRAAATVPARRRRRASPRRAAPRSDSARTDEGEGGQEARRPSRHPPRRVAGPRSGARLTGRRGAGRARPGRRRPRASRRRSRCRRPRAERGTGGTPAGRRRRAAAGTSTAAGLCGRGPPGARAAPGPRSGPAPRDAGRPPRPAAPRAAPGAGRSSSGRRASGALR